MAVPPAAAAIPVPLERNPQFTIQIDNWLCTTGRLSTVQQRSIGRYRQVLINEIASAAQEIFDAICVSVKQDARKRISKHQVTADFACAESLLPIFTYYLNAKFYLGAIHHWYLSPQDNKKVELCPGQIAVIVGKSFHNGPDTRTIYTGYYSVEWQQDTLSFFDPVIVGAFHTPSATTHAPNVHFWNIRKTEIYDTAEIVCGSGDDKVIEKAHLLYLRCYTPFLHAALTVEMIEKRSGRIELKDTDPNLFKIAHSFLYLGPWQEELTIQQLIDLYTIADRWFFDALKAECVNKMYEWVGKNPVDEENFAVHFHIAMDHKKEKHLEYLFNFLERVEKWDLLPKLTEEDLDFSIPLTDEKCPNLQRHLLALNYKFQQAAKAQANAERRAALLPAKKD